MHLGQPKDHIGPIINLGRGTWPSAVEPTTCAEMPIYHSPKHTPTAMSHTDTPHPPRTHTSVLEIVKFAKYGILYRFSGNEPLLGIFSDYNNIFI